MWTKLSKAIFPNIWSSEVVILLFCCSFTFCFVVVVKVEVEIAVAKGGKSRPPKGPFGSLPLPRRSVLWCG
jgi:hypothetical protein